MVVTEAIIGPAIVITSITSDRAAGRDGDVTFRNANRPGENISYTSWFPAAATDAAGVDRRNKPLTVSTISVIVRQSAPTTVSKNTQNFATGFGRTYHFLNRRTKLHISVIQKCKRTPTPSNKVMKLLMSQLNESITERSCTLTVSEQNWLRGHL